MPRKGHPLFCAYQNLSAKVAFEECQDKRAEQRHTKHGTESRTEQSLIGSQASSGIAYLYGYGGRNEHTGYGPFENWPDEPPEKIAHFAHRFCYFVAPQPEHL